MLRALARINHNIYFGTSAWLIFNAIAIELGKASKEFDLNLSILENVHQLNFVMAFALIVIVSRLTRLPRAIMTFAKLCAYTFVVTMVVYLTLYFREII